MRMVACGDSHTVAVTEEGSLWAWGEGTRGKLGHDDERNRLEPEEVGAERFGGAKIVTASCGHQHTAAVTEEGAFYTWGAGLMSREPRDGVVPIGLGHENLEDKPVPTLIDPALLPSVCLAPGRQHAMAVAMGTHLRLGGGSAIMLLAGEPGLVEMVMREVVRVVGRTRAAEGLARLLGGFR